MPLYHIVTKSRRGHAAEHTVVAQTREAAVRQLTAQDTFVVSVRRTALPTRSRRRTSPLGLLWPVPLDRRAEFLRQLHEMLSAGLPLAEVLEQLRDRTSDSRLRRLCQEGMEAARQGAKLSEILAAHPECFEPWVAASVSAAERAGALDALLPVVVEDHRQVSRERARLTYPKVYAKAIAVLAVIAATLPLAITHGLGFWLVNTLVNGLPLLAIGLLAWHGLRLVGRLGPVQSLVERITSRLPVMGKGQRVAYARRFLRAYRDMVRAGCLPQEAMEAAASVAGPARLEARGMRAAEHLRRGGDLPTALAMAGVLDRKTRGLLETAEETGELDVMLDECLEMLDDEADRQSLRRSIWSWALLLLLTAVLVGAGVIVGVVGYYNRIMEFYDSFLTE